MSLINYYKIMNYKRTNIMIDSMALRAYWMSFLLTFLVCHCALQRINVSVCVNRHLCTKLVPLPVDDAMLPVCLI